MIDVKRWPAAEDVRDLDSRDAEALGRLMMRVICPHLDTSKHQRTSDSGGWEYCNTCGASRLRIE